MKKLTASVLLVVVTSSFALVNAQDKKNDTVRTTDIREVVVTGALNIKKRQDAVTAANQVVSNEEITQGKNPNAIQALTGKVSGLQINTTNNSVNSTTRIVLRGPRSISGNNEALIVIDGVISTATVLQNLPPEIIESQNVIKGMQGAALYGDRGSNGVIIVTTVKSSKADKLAFSLTNSIDFSTVYKLPIMQDRYGQGWPGDSFDPTDYGGTTWVPYENTNWGPAYSSALGGQELFIGAPQANNQFLKETFSFKKDHIKNFFKTGVLLQNGLSVSAGGRDSYAFLSVNRAQNDFIVEKDKSARNNIILKAGKKFGKFGVDVNINYQDLFISETTSGLYDDLLQSPTNLDIRKFRNSMPDQNYTLYADNPYWTIDNNRFDTKRNSLNAVLNLNYELNDHISFSYAGTMASNKVFQQSYRNYYANDAAWQNTGTILDGSTAADYGREPIISNFNRFTSQSSRYYGDLMINLNYDLTSDINFKANIGHNIQDEKVHNSEVGGDNLKIPGWYHINNVLQPTQFSQLNNGSTYDRSFAWFGNFDFSYKDYLFLNATARYEKSSRISVNPVGPNKEKLPFMNTPFPYYSAGLSFIPTKAIDGLKGDVLHYAKLSLSYTKVGNVRTIPVFGLDRVGVFPTGFPFGDTSAYISNTREYDINIKPEFLYSKEASINLGFFKDRVTLDGSFFRNDTDNLITAISTSSASGINSLLTNVGKSRNQGYEIDLGLTPFKSKDFEWKLRGSYSTYKNTILELADGSPEVPLTVYTTTAVGIYAVQGEDFPVIKGSKYQRDPNGNIIVSAEGNPLTTSTLEVLGKVNPDYILGFNTSIKFKGITLSATADYRTGNSFVSFTKNLLGFTGSLEKSADFDRSQGYVVPGSVQNTGTAAAPVYTANTTPVGNNASYTGVNAYFGGAYRNVGEEFVVDGTALKVREIALNYSLPKSVLKNTFVTGLTLGVYARNPFFIYAKDNRNYADPETASTNGNAAGIALTGQYPNSRNFGFNLNVNF